MKLEALRPERYPQFHRFNQDIFPTRVSVPARFQFQMLDNPLLADKQAPDVALVSEDDGTILGQVILQPVEYHYDGTRARGYMGVDLFVKESARNTRAGGAVRTFFRNCWQTAAFRNGSFPSSCSEKSASV